MGFVEQGSATVLLYRTAVTVYRGGCMYVPGEDACKNSTCEACMCTLL